MTSSLYEPNTPLLRRFHGIEELCRVVSREDVTTRTLDSLLPEIGPIVSGAAALNAATPRAPRPSLPLPAGLSCTLAWRVCCSSQSDVRVLRVRWGLRTC